MAKHPTTIRLDEHLRKTVVREARKAGLSLSSIVHLLLAAFASGRVQIGVTQYPKSYLDVLGREADELRRLHRKGKAKSFASSRELFDAILGR